MSDSFRERREAAEAALRADLAPGERVIAVGRCADLTHGGDPAKAGAAKDFAMVTDRAVRWRPISHSLETRREAVLFAAVTDAKEFVDGHRSAFMLVHEPQTRIVSVPRAWWVWWDRSKLVERVINRSIIATSSSTTGVATALREELHRRGFTECRPWAIGSDERRRRDRALRESKAVLTRLPHRD